MLWLFVLLGAVGSASALHGLIGGAAQGRFSPPAALSAIFLAAAWWVGHATGGGWMLLIAGLAAETTRRILSKAHPAIEDLADETPSPVAAIEPESPTARIDAGVSQTDRNNDERIAPPPPEPAARIAPPPLVSCALLKEMVHLTPDVFLASLRRAGERTAAHDSAKGTADGPCFHVGDMRLCLRRVHAPIKPEELQTAVSQSWDFPGAAAIATHIARIEFKTQVSHDGVDPSSGVLPEQVLRLHVLAHRALAEFAPVAAVYWPASWRLVSMESLAQAAQTADVLDLARATCLLFRTFPLTGEEQGRFLCDSVGLHAFGLRDMEIIIDGEPDESVSEMLHHAAGGWLRDPAAERASARPTSVSHADESMPTETISQFGPSRPVLRLVLRNPI